MEEIKSFYKTKATKIVKKFQKENGLGENMHINQWCFESGVSGYVLFINGKMISVALISKCKIDPLKTQKNPHVLNYVYTLKEFRRKGYAEKLIKHVKEVTEFSAFCPNEKVVKLFEKANCRNFGDYNNTIMMRTS